MAVPSCFESKSYNYFLSASFFAFSDFEALDVLAYSSTFLGGADLAAFHTFAATVVFVGFRAAEAMDALARDSYFMVKSVSAAIFSLSRNCLVATSGCD